MKNKKLIFFVINKKVIDVFLNNHIEKLTKEYHISFISSEYSKKLNINNQEYVNNFVNLKRSFNIFNFISNCFNTLKIIIHQKPNLIISIHPKNGLILSSLKYFYKFSFLHIVTGQIWSNKKGFKKFIFKFFDKFLFTKSNYLLADSKMQIKFLNTEGFDKFNITCIKNGSICGVNTNIYNASIINKKKFFLQNKISPETKLILYVGRINYSKGILILLESFKYLTQKYNYKLKLIIIGDDEINFRNILNFKYPFLLDKVILKNHTTRTPFFYSVSDIFCLPSFREGFGMSVIEASSSRIPVVISDIYGLSDSIINNHTGIKFKSGNTNDLTSKLKYLLDNPKLVKEFGKNGRQFVKKNFDYKMVNNFLYNYLKKII